MRAIEPCKALSRSHRRRWISLVLLMAYCCLSGVIAPLSAQSTLNVYFLYGSRPAKAYRTSETKWFGGKMGGHVALGLSADSLLNFMPLGKFHRIAHRDPKHSHYILLDSAQFGNVFGGSGGAIKTATIEIPIDSAKRSNFIEIETRYLAETPYDYAFLGIRCASATDEILAKLGVTRKRSYWGTIFGTFHPKVLRKRLLKLARTAHWKVTFTRGSNRRRWQR